jgi:hypothetical protein
MYVVAWQLLVWWYTIPPSCHGYSCSSKAAAISGCNPAHATAFSPANAPWHPPRPVRPPRCRCRSGAEFAVSGVFRFADNDAMKAAAWPLPPIVEASSGGFKVQVRRCFRCQWPISIR